MSERERLTTDKPCSNTETMLNYAYAKDGRVVLRYGDGEQNIDLCDYISRKAKERCCAYAPTPEEVMNGECTELDCNCVLSEFYTVATQAAELRERLKGYEDSENSLRYGRNSEKERLIELIQKSVNGCARNWAETIADYLLENGVIVPPVKIGDTVYMIVEKRAKVSREYFHFIKKTKLTFLNLERVLENWGKTVFLSREQAEKALKDGAE